jgi:DNA modification methylase
MPHESPKAIVYLGDSRCMTEVGDASIDLAVTSPPYWHIKDYGCPGQIGHGQSLHRYLHSLALIWNECRRALREGGRLCVNIGDQFARSTVYGRYRVIPLHAEIIRQCELLDLDFLGSIVWQKKTTMNTSGGAVIMGSFPFPPNGIVELDYEHILIFKKPGKPRKMDRAVREASRLTTEEWKTFFCGHWNFAGARKSGGHEAAFPEELPRRLIRMFSFPGDTVLDPFLGTGTTAKVALELGRSAVGYEINPGYAKLAAENIGEGRGAAAARVELLSSPNPAAPQKDLPGYVPGIRDARPPAPDRGRAAAPRLFTVESVHDDCALTLDSGRIVRFLGVRITERDAAHAYLSARVLRKKVFLKDEVPSGDGSISAYVYLKNKIFVNANLVKSGAGRTDGSSHRLARKFEALARHG